MRLRHAVWVMAGLAWAQAAPAQRLVGRVFDETRHPIEGVEVIVNRREVRATTDSAGVFQIEVSRTDSTLAFRRIGYRPMLFAMRPLPSPDDTILVQLAGGPVRLAEVVVSAEPDKPLRYAGTTKYDEVFLRQKVGLGTLISRDAIETRFGFATDELLRGVAGIHIWNGPPKRIRFTRCSEPGGVAIFIDGIRQIPSSSLGSTSGQSATGLIMQRSGSAGTREDEPEIEILSRVNPSDIEMIEVFRGASEIPGVFHWNGCAVIAIWTRWNN